MRKTNAYKTLTGKPPDKRSFRDTEEDNMMT
jgi:hypothetical protein